MSILLSLIALAFGDFFKENFELESKELTSYEGEDLSSIYDFRENSIKGYQYVTKETYRLTISGLVNNTQQFTYDEVLNSFTSYKKVVELFCVEGWEVNILWEGILVKELLNTTNVSTNATTIIFHAYDGYTTSFPLDFIIDNDIILAHKINGVTLPPERGFPFQLVAESKWGYKWIKWVTEIEVSDDSDYEGYWESRGYSNEGDLNKGFFD